VTRPRPFPKGTAGVVFADAFEGGPPVYHIMPASKAAKMIKDQHLKGAGRRPVTPDSKHAYVRTVATSSFGLGLRLLMTASDQIVSLDDVRRTARPTRHHVPEHIPVDL
jgi:hypothetical protein